MDVEVAAGEEGAQDAGGDGIECDVAVDGNNDIECDVDMEEAEEEPMPMVEEGPQDRSEQEAAAHLALAHDFARDHQGASLLPLALTLPGVLHIVHNTMKEIKHNLPGWDTFWPKLQVLERLLKDGRRARFIRFCLLESPLRGWAKELEHAKFGSLYESRWGEVASFCLKVVDWRPVLRAAWDANKFRRGPQVASRATQSDKEFNPDEMTNIMKDNGFWGYLQMAAETQKVVQGLADWAEGCECHKDIVATVESIYTRRVGGAGLSVTISNKLDF